MKTLKMFYILILITSLFNGIAMADFIFGVPMKVPNVNSDYSDSYPQISRDGLELYFTSNRDGNEDIWISRRPTINDPWGEPVKFDTPLDIVGRPSISVNTSGPEVSPSLSADGLELYFDRKDDDLWVSTRVSKDDPWGQPKKLASPVNTKYRESHPCISADGLELYFMSDRPGARNTDIFVATRPTKDDPWREPVKLGPQVNGDQYESLPYISSNGLLLFFGRGYSKGHVHICRRITTEESWGYSKFFAPVNSGTSIFGAEPGDSEFNVSFSEGDSTIYFARGTDVFSNDWNIWQVEVTPIVDLNSDGIVDELDMCILVDVDNWYTENTLCDIAPAPMGDGFVDVQDLIVLAEHLFEEYPPPGAVE
jgi:hypothetical protein